MNGVPIEEAAGRARISALRVSVLCVMAGLGLYLFVLQVIKGIEFEQRAQSVARRSSVVTAQRGVIYDRFYSRPLVANRPAFSIDVVPGEVPDGEMRGLFAALGEVLGVSPEFLAGRVPPSQRHLFRRIEVLDGVDVAEVTYLGERIDRFPGVYWRNEPVRDYRDLGSLAHVIGYLGDITAEELQVKFNQGYQRGDMIGKSGVEQEFDVLLRGVDGVHFRRVDARERDLGVDEAGLAPTPGHDLVLTIDARTQRLAEQALARRKGAVVVLHPATGEILAMVSYPWFDPGAFRRDGGVMELRRLSVDPSYPFINRAVRAVYPPASLFKLILTVAVLEERIIPPEKTILCRGSFPYGDRVFLDHKLEGHGAVDLREAIAQSCNVYYYSVGDALGVERITHYARTFGLGISTGIELPGEKAGFVPTPSWKQQVRGSSWVGGDTINLSIGQGFITATPLQIANVVAAIVNDGVVYRPHVVKEVRSGVDGSLVQQTVPTPLLTIDLQPKTFASVREAMRYAVTDGTPKAAITTPAVEAAGKTGTAQTRAGQSELGEGQHSWFAAFAPADAPVEEQVVVVVMAEAADVWEWWAPKVANVLLHGMFTGLDYDDVIDDLQPVTPMYSLIGEQPAEETSEGGTP